MQPLDFTKYQTLFNQEQGHKRSDKYQLIPTGTILDNLQRHGFTPSSVQEVQKRNANQQGKAKHLVRMRHDSIACDGDTVPELILINAHDGTSTYKLMLGLYRFACANGIIAGDTFGEVKVHHIGHRATLDAVLDASMTMIKKSLSLTQAVARLKNINLTHGQRLEYANSAKATLQDNNIHIPDVDIANLVFPRRSADNSTDLWTTFNVAQENLIKGGVVTSQRSKTGRIVTSRAVGSIDRSVDINRALFDHAVKYADRLDGATC